MPRAIRLLVLTLVFGVQIAGIVHARFADTRYLCWAPYDQMAFYRIEADRHGVALSSAEIAARYRMSATGRENRSIHHVLDAIAQYEATYGRTDLVTARVVYRVNGGKEQVWTSAR
jgi:hypothetical protein